MSDSRKATCFTVVDCGKDKDRAREFKEYLYIYQGKLYDDTMHECTQVGKALSKCTKNTKRNGEIEK